MRAGCDTRRAALAFGLVLLAGCSAGSSADERAQCLGGFCLPAAVVIVGREQPADFTLYQIVWRGEQFGLYAGDYPDFDIKRAAPHAVPLDPDALLIAGDGSAQVRMRLGDASPRYLQLGGRCDDIKACNLGKLAQAISREPG